jgi:tetratricopeptide (TPR) repeat protein
MACNVRVGMCCGLLQALLCVVIIDAKSYSQTSVAAAAPDHKNAPQTDQPSENKAQKGSDATVTGPDCADIPLEELNNRALADQTQKAAVEFAIKGALSAGSIEAGVKFYEDYIKQYPTGGDTVAMMNRLANAYGMLQRFDDAEHMFHEARTLAGDDRFVSTISINEGWLYMERGDYGAAKKCLKEVMDKPVPASLSDPYAVTPQLFIAPLFYSRVLVKEGQAAEAEKLISDVAQKALRMTKENPGTEWLPSYVQGAYQELVNLQLEKEPPDFQKARAACEEFNVKMPDYSGNVSYGTMLRSIEMCEERFKSKNMTR